MANFYCRRRRHQPQLKTVSISVWCAIFCFLYPITNASDCSVSTPNLSDPIGAISTDDDYGWFGSENLATVIPQDGHWSGMGSEHNFRDKPWWWYRGYITELGTAEKLNIVASHLSSGKEIDLFSVSGAYEGSDNYSWDSMSTALEFPDEGCWQVIGTHENEKLVFNLRVGERSS